MNGSLGSRFAFGEELLVVWCLTCGHPIAFTRSRKLPLPALVVLLLTGMRKSVQAELDEFFVHLNQKAQLVRHVSAQAFALARAKLSARAIPDLNDWVIRRAQHLDKKTYLRFHLKGPSKTAFLPTLKFPLVWAWNPNFGALWRRHHLLRIWPKCHPSLNQTICITKCTEKQLHRRYF